MIGDQQAHGLRMGYRRGKINSPLTFLDIIFQRIKYLPLPLRPFCESLKQILFTTGPPSSTSKI